jgi:pimeloyl-ACP methyl ester carboxylesterase
MKYPNWREGIQRRSVESADGTRIAYEVLGQGRDVLLLANGLGGRLYAWEPLIERYHPYYRIICWDYRGLFDSGRPKSHRELAINRHVDDAIAILEQEQHRRAVLVGWSMGVQVSLDVAATRPELVAGLVLINGTYGHAFKTAGQPVLTVPGAQRAVHMLVELIRRQIVPLEWMRTIFRTAEPATLATFVLTAGPKAFEMGPMLRQYFDDVLGESFDNYMHLFQELDAHSVYHVLPRIQAPALVISGMLDPLTPVRQSHEIARRLPNAEHLRLRRSSHFSLMERPEKVLPAIDAFLEKRVAW